MAVRKNVTLVIADSQFTDYFLYCGRIGLELLLSLKIE
jgi:hypothetical protein